MYPETMQRLLIVDDEPNNIRLLASMFNENYDILFATNGKQAIEIALKEKPDLILLDVIMPEMDGYQVCTQLKNDPVLAEVPIIFITSISDIESEVYGLEIGASDFITKPFYPAIVKIRVQNQIELYRARKQLTELATTDGLTSIANRRFFDEQLAIEWQRAKRTDQVLAIAMIDVDWFKNYNDCYGHQAGDDCLRQIAKVLTYSAKRGSDFVARYGGEEFALILPTTQDKTALIMAENICKTMSDLNLPHAQSEFGKVTLSIGVAVKSPNIIETAESLISHADEALYMAKSRGRNQAVLFHFT